MESLSDFLSRSQQVHGNGPLEVRADFMNMRPSLSDESTEQRHDYATPESERGIDHLVRGLIDLLPRPNGLWRIEDRVKWLRLAADIFDVGYKAGDGEPGEISIVAVKQRSC
jgi:hypothetical protein